MNTPFTDAYSIAHQLAKKLDKPLENYAGYTTAKALDEFSALLVDYRIKNHMTQADLADMLGIRQPMVSQYEAGTNNITVKRLCELCEKIGVRISLSYEDTAKQKDEEVQFTV